MITTVKNLIFPSNTYLISDANKHCIIIDPGLSPELVFSEIDQKNLVPKAIISTHGHFDHVAGVATLREKYDLPFYLHEKDEKLARSGNFYLKLMKINFFIKPTKPNFLLEGFKNIVKVEDFTITFYNYPGHSKGSCILQYENNLFCGDSIYKNGLGFNNFPGENKNELKTTILSIIESFPRDQNIYPGHGDSFKLKDLSNNKELMQFLSNNDK